MKKITPSELTDLLNKDGGIPKGEEVHFSAIIRGIKDSSQDFRNNTFLEYNGHVELFSKGNKEYILRCHDVAFLFTQVDNVKVNIGYNDSELFIPIEYRPREIGIYRPENIKL